MKYKKLDWGLMHNNITPDDKKALIQFIRKSDRFTNGPKVVEFEEAWSKWLGVKHSVFVNSGASANLLTMAYLALENRTKTEVIVPSLTWVSDIASVIQAGFTPTFVDIDSRTLGMSAREVENARNGNTRAVFLTHVMGLPATIPSIPFDFLVEDCCESHGATINGKKVGTHSRISNFSFYFAHHMTTIEGGMICTNEESVYQVLRSLRSHGMVREMTNEDAKQKWAEAYPDVHPSFMFMTPGFNCRSTELNAVLGLSQLKRLDENNAVRVENFKVFLNELCPRLYRTDLATEGAVPYSLLIIMKEPDVALRDRIEWFFDLCGVEYRRGLSGGGNQLRQPYLMRHPNAQEWKKEDFPQVEHITDFSWYVGNYPGLEHKKIKALCRLLNQF